MGLKRRTYKDEDQWPQIYEELIEKIKRHGKRLSQTTSSEIEHETANVIYYAAIASALVFYDEKITQFSYKNLEESFSVFMQTEWISNDLKELFEKAENDKAKGGNYKFYNCKGCCAVFQKKSH